MEQEEQHYLHIPSGLKTRTELFEGYGRDEVMATIMVHGAQEIKAIA